MNGSVMLMCGVGDGRGRRHHHRLAKLERIDGRLSWLVASEADQRFLQEVPINGVPYLITLCTKEHGVLQVKVADVHRAIDTGQRAIALHRAPFPFRASRTLC